MKTALTLLLLTNATFAFADLRVEAPPEGIRPLGGAIAYTLDPSGVYLDVANHIATLQVKEVEDFRGLYTMVPNLSAYLAQNAELLDGIDARLSQTDRTQSETYRFTQGEPGMMVYAFRVDLSKGAGQQNLSRLLKKIAPTVGLSDDDRAALLK